MFPYSLTRHLHHVSALSTSNSVAPMSQNTDLTSRCPGTYIVAVVPEWPEMRDMYVLKLYLYLGHFTVLHMGFHSDMDVEILSQ